MSILHLVALALATWTLTYLLVFSFLCARLREAVGISYDLDKTGRPIDRWAHGIVGEIVNCYSCVALLLAPLVYLAWRWGGDWLLCVLAATGGAHLIGRWYISQRPRMEWWL